MAGGPSLYHDEDAGTITDINVTPLVDVMLVLLVIFMVTAKLIVGRGIVVDKPKAATGSEVKATLRSTVDKNGHLFVNGTQYDEPAAATARIAEIAKDMPDPRAMITGDGSAAYRDIMRAIDVTKAAHVKHIALENEPLKTPAD